MNAELLKLYFEIEKELMVEESKNFQEFEQLGVAIKENNQKKPTSSLRNKFLMEFVENKIFAMIKKAKEPRINATIKEDSEIILEELGKILGDDLKLAKKIQRENKIRKILYPIEQT